MIEVTDLAWMAGIIDLKGRIIVKNNKSRATPQIVLAVQCKEYAIIRRLGQLVGTSPELVKARETPDWMRRGCDEHCPEPHVHVNGGPPGAGPGSLVATARWTVTGVGMAVVLTALRPYLQVHRDYEEAIEAITANMVHAGQGVGMVRKQLDRMKELGWTIPEEFSDLADVVYPAKLIKHVTADEVQAMILDALHGKEIAMT
jgi:hypothetical protein